jgi:hypothetical protein
MQMAKNWWWVVVAAVVVVFAYSIFANSVSEDRRGPSARIAQ